MSKLRQSAKGQSCTFRIPGVCNGDPETVVLCHAPHPDKGMGKKGPDTWAAYGCGNCHSELDGRSRSFDWSQYQAVDAAKALVWYHAIRETQRRLIAKGLMPK